MTETNSETFILYNMFFPVIFASDIFWLVCIAYAKYTWNDFWSGFVDTFTEI